MSIELSSKSPFPGGLDGYKKENGEILYLYLLWGYILYVSNAIVEIWKNSIKNRKKLTLVDLLYFYR